MLDVKHLVSNLCVRKPCTETVGIYSHLAKLNSEAYEQREGEDSEPYSIAKSVKLSWYF